MYSGGMNNQTYAAAGVEANLDTQFAYGLTHPTPATFYSTGGSPPYIPDAVTPTDTNEPYVNVRFIPVSSIYPSFICICYSGWTTCPLKNTSPRRFRPVMATMNKQVPCFITRVGVF